MNRQKRNRDCEEAVDGYEGRSKGGGSDEDDYNGGEDEDDYAEISAGDDDYDFELEQKERQRRRGRRSGESYGGDDKSGPGGKKKKNDTGARRKTAASDDEFNLKETRDVKGRDFDFGGDLSVEENRRKKRRTEEKIEKYEELEDDEIEAKSGRGVVFVSNLF